MEPPTSDTDLTLALGAICFAFYLYQGFKSQGASYLKSFLGPMLLLAPLMLPIEVADNLFRPFSLGVRLFANMFADHQVLEHLHQIYVPGGPARVLCAGLRWSAWCRRWSLRSCRLPTCGWRARLIIESRRELATK